MISIIIINDLDTAKYLQETLSSIEEKIADIAYEVIVVNLKIEVQDDSNDKLKVYYLKTDNYSKAKNFGAQKSRYNHIFFLKAGIVIKVNPFTYFFEKFKSRNYGAVGLKVFDYKNHFKINFSKEIGLSEEIEEDAANKKILSGNIQKALELENKFHDIASVGRVSGEAIIINKNVLSSAGGFNEYLIKYYEDADLCKRLMDLKYVNYFYPFCKLVDLRVEDIDLPAHLKSRLRYYKLHNSFLIRSVLRISLAVKYFFLSLIFSKQNFPAFKSVLFPY